MHVAGSRAIRPLLMVVVFAAYANSFNNPFQYDDGHSIVENPHIRSLVNVPEFFVDPAKFSGDPAIAMYRPLLLVTYALNHSIGGYDVWSYHGINVLLHLLCALLVFAIASSLLGDSPSAAFAALLFALHPIQTEAVNYISSRSEILASLFVLVSLWLHIARPAGGEWRVGKIACYAAGLLTKSSAIVLPALLLCYDLVVKRRPIRQLWRQYVVYAVLAFAYLGIVGQFLKSAAFDAPVRPFDEQFWSQIKGLVLYAKLLHFPRGLSIDHQFLISDTLFDPIAAAAFVAVASSLVLAARCRSQSLPAFLLVWTGIALAPTLVIPLNVMVNEHRLYLPCAAFAIAGGWALGRLATRASATWVAIPVGAALLLALGITTVQRNQIWSDAESLWSDAASKAPLMARPLIWLGDVYASQGRNDEAIGALQTALERDPDYLAGYAKLGRLLADEGRLREAEQLLAQGAERSGPEAVAADVAALWGTLADVYRQQAQRSADASLLQKSHEAYSAALALSPRTHAFHDNLGNVCQLLSRPQEALAHHRRALSLSPANAQTHVNIGNAFQMVRQLDSAKAHYETAVALDSVFAGAWANLGSSYLAGGDRRRAQRAFARAAALDPRFASLDRGLGEAP